MRRLKKILGTVIVAVCMTLSIGVQPWTRLANAAPNSVPTVTAPQALTNRKLGSAKTVGAARDTRQLKTKAYDLKDNTGYRIPENESAHPLKKRLADISLQVNEGRFIDGGKQNGHDAFGFLMRVPPEEDGKAAADKEEETGDENEKEIPAIELRLKYNYEKTDKLLGCDGKEWAISKDSYKKGVNNITDVGVVGTGALLVQKSYTGNADDFKWQNPINYGTTKSFHTTDFTTHYQPYHYSGTPRERTYEKTKFDDDGKETGKEKVTETTDGALTIFTPSGEDLAKGVYLKVLLAYELKYSYYDWWYGTVTNYKNVVEESTVYIVNSSAEVLFQNVYISNENQEIVDGDEGASRVVQLAGTIFDGHGTNEGFVLKANGDDKITYRKDDANSCNAKSGDAFYEPGRYVFTVTPKIGTPRTTTIYINERGVQRNIELYFKQGILTKNSRRIFTDGKIPVFEAGKTWFKTEAVSPFRMPLNGRIQRMTGQTLVEIGADDKRYDKEKPAPQYVAEPNFETIATLNADQSRSVWKGENEGLLAKDGYYTAEFSNNPDYFPVEVDGKLVSKPISGDFYNFTFQFQLKNDYSKPTINQGLLEKNLSFSSYAAGYWGVTLPSKGAGKITFAHATYADAHSFAYEYYRSQVEFKDGNYYFEKSSYPTQIAVLAAVKEAANKLIARKYFDASDIDSFLTVNNGVTDVLNQVIARDVVVLRDAMNAHGMTAGLPSLNDRRTHKVDDYGNVITEPVKFIQVSDFETTGVVTLTHEKLGLKYEIDYYQPVEAFLRARNASTGQYKVLEKNVYGAENIYTATYTRPGDLQTEIDIEWSLNGVVAKDTIGQAIRKDKGQEAGADQNKIRRYEASSLVIKSAKNELDPYGILKITRDGAWTKIYQLIEVKDLKLEEEGSYAITLVDRLGNYATHYVDIFVASKVYNLTLKNCGEEVLCHVVQGGQIVKLETPTNPDPLLEFMGWQDEKGNLYKDKYRFSSQSDVTLTAVWHYRATAIEAFDGNPLNLETSEVKPGAKVLLPELDDKDGLKLFGFANKNEDNTLTFYIGQITKVPNVPKMTLQAMWIDESQTLTLEAPSRPGMIFAGWIHPTGKLEGTIYAHGDVPEDITVYSLWLTAPTESAEEGKSPIASGTTMPFGGGSLTGNAKTVGLVGGIIGAAAIVFGVMLFLLKKKSRKNPALAFATAEVDGGTEETALSAVGKTRREKSRFQFGNFGIKCTAFIMAVVMAFTIASPMVSGVRQSEALAATQVTQELASGVSDAQGLSLPDADPDTVKRNEYIEQNTAAFEDPQAFVAENTELAKSEVSDDEAFLYALIYYDLLMQGYDAFPALAQKEDGETVRGFCYTDYEEAFTKEGSSKEAFFGAGFVALFQDSIAEEEVKKGVEIVPIVEDEETEQREWLTKYGFILIFEDQYGPIHYIANGRYIRYSIKDFQIQIEANEPDDVAKHALWGTEFGYLYSYDLEQAVYDPALLKNTLFKPDAFSITQGSDYDFALKHSKNLIADQDDNYFTVDTMSLLFISRQAIADMMYFGQTEKYLGIDSSTLYYIESNLDSTVFYYIDAAGEVKVAPIPPDPSLFKIILSLAQIALGGILVATGVGVGFGAMLMLSGTVGLLSELYAEEIGTIFNGLGTIGNGLKCLMVGIQVIGCWPVGTILGITMIAVGGATMLMGANDVIMGFTGRNLIREWTGMSDKAYMWLNIGLNVMSTLLTITASIANAKGMLCFVAGTGVLTVAANGAIVKKAIEDVKIGDRVMSYNESTGMTEVKTVTGTSTSTHSEVVKVGRADGQVITSSLSHPYYTQRGWIEAKDLRAGDILQTVNGKTVVVEFVQHELLETPIILYNFSVEDNHNYYVAENADCDVSEFVLAHNECNKLGRAGRQARLKEIANDPKTPKEIRGQMNTRYKQKGYYSLPKGRGYQLAHRPGLEAAKGFSYKFSDLQTVDLHKLWHSIAGYK